MDLLFHNYGSSSSDDEDNEDRNDADGPPNTTPTTAAAAAAVVVVAVEQPKGKRILSLASVLPAHILAALTQQRGITDASDSDDDEIDLPNHLPQQQISSHNDDDATEGHCQHRLTPAANANANAKSSLVSSSSSSPEFASFLKDLHQVGFQTSTKNHQKCDAPGKDDTKVHATSSSTGTRRLHPIPTTNTTDATVTAPAATQSTRAPLPAATTTTTTNQLGNAFVDNIVTTTTRSKKNRTPHPKASFVRNIHQDDNDDDGIQVIVETAPGQDDDEVSTIITSTDALDASSSFPSQQRRYNRVQAAPRVDLSTTAVGINLPQQQQELLPTLDCTNETTLFDQEPSKRHFSRKELERRLRRNNGNATVNINDIWNDTGWTQTQQGVDPNLYAPCAPPPTSVATTSSAPYTVRNVATHMYDPSTGTTVPVANPHSIASSSSGGGGNTTDGTILQKGKGKNQIHHLLAQAVKLERERSQQHNHASHTTTTSAIQLHRANAKRKYGW
jgi:hypothetical protein